MPLPDDIPPACRAHWLPDDERARRRRLGRHRRRLLNFGATLVLLWLMVAGFSPYGAPPMLRLAAMAATFAVIWTMTHAVTGRAVSLMPSRANRHAIAAAGALPPDRLRRCAQRLRDRHGGDAVGAARAERALALEEADFAAAAIWRRVEAMLLG